MGVRTSINVSFSSSYRFVHLSLFSLLECSRAYIFFTKSRTPWVRICHGYIFVSVKKVGTDNPIHYNSNIVTTFVG
jgi:hypothetical protein